MFFAIANDKGISTISVVSLRILKICKVTQNNAVQHPGCLCICCPLHNTRIASHLEPILCTLMRVLCALIMKFMLLTVYVSKSSDKGVETGYY